MKILFNFLKSKKKKKRKVMVSPVVMYRWEIWIIKSLSAKVLKLLSCGVEKDS